MKRLKSYSLSTGLKYSYILLILTALISLTIALVTNLTNQDLITPTQAAPTTFTVDSTADTGDATPGDDICDTGGGICTLRAAIEEANGDADLDTIQFGIPNTDGNHLCYADDSVANQVTPANEEVTTAQDACSSGSTIDPDHPYTWFRTTAAARLTISEQADIQGFTQTGASANTIAYPGGLDSVLKIEVDFNSYTGSTPFVLDTNSAGTTVSGLALNNVNTASTYLWSASSVNNVTFNGNYGGVDISGLIARGAQDTIGFYQTNADGLNFGGPNPADRNIFSNFSNSIYVRSNNDNVNIQGNIVGLNRDGDTAIANANSGILLGDDVNSSTVSENISGNNGINGVTIGVTAGANSNNNHVFSNRIGVGADGSAHTNSSYGVRVRFGSHTNTIGTDGDGTNDANEGNVISNSTTHGVFLDGAGIDNNVIAGNFIGTDVSGNGDMGNVNDGVRISGGGSNNIIGTNGDGTSDADERNIISGNDIHGVRIHTSTNNTVAGNYIGIGADGTTALDNDGDGVYLSTSADSNTVGTDGDGTADTAERNVISSNGDRGIHVLDSDNNQIAANYIGTNAAGTAAIGNGTVSATGDGVYLQDSDGTTVGTDGDGTADSDEGNLVSGNNRIGVAIVSTSTNTTVAGNIIGLNAAGTAALANTSDGVTMSGTVGGNTIGTDGDGTADADERNIISGNGSEGVSSSTDNNIIAGNYVGTDINGTAAVANTSYGVYVHSGASNNTVGTDGDGTADAAERNVISGNSSHGVHIQSSTLNTVAGNYIGTASDGSTDLGNSATAVILSANADSNTVGTDGDGTADSDEGNVLSGNGDYGVYILTTSINNVVAGNHIGLNAAGTGIVTNDDSGILIQSSSTGNRIGTNADGTSDTDERNLISGNTISGIVISGANTNTVAGNYIGTDITGAVDLGNTINGIRISGGATSTTVGTNGDGTNDATERNIISGNDDNGVEIEASDSSTVAGNYIGTDVNGTADLGNTSDGVQVSAGSTGTIIGTSGDGSAGEANEGNVISGNDDEGIEILDTGTDNNVVAGNHIGTNAAGDAAVSNTSHGIYVHTDAQNNRIGTDADGTSDTEERNVISGNDTIGVGGIIVYASNNDIYGNYVGVSADGNSAIPNHAGIAVGSGGTTGINVGGPLAAQRNIVSGNAPAYGIADLGGNTIQNNYVGTNAAGTAVLGNATIGIGTSVSTGTIIGTDGDGVDDANEGNLIAGNGTVGVNFFQSNNAVVAGNMIGTDVTGTLDFGNGTQGVYVYGGSTGVTIGTNGDGTSDTAERNVISGNDDRGIFITGAGTDNNTVAGNYIGVDVTGAADLGNADDGINLTLSSSSNTIGTDGDGTADVDERNVISGNGDNGIALSASTNNIIAGNYIGTNAAGTSAIATLSSGSGVNIESGSDSNRVGTNADGTADVDERNVVSGNWNGVRMYLSDNNVVAGNYIGVAADGTSALGNTNHGVPVLTDSDNNRVGGSNAAEPNIIANNALAGVRFLGAMGGANNPIINNSIYNNGELGIDHQNALADLPDPNDHLDTDSGSNDGLNYPVVLNNNPSHPSYPIATTNPSIDVYLDVDVTETTNFLVQLYDNPSGLDPSGHGEGEVFVANANVTAAAGGVTTTLNFTGNISDPANIALTITEDLGGGNYGSTSEFSSPYDQYLQGRVFNDLFNDNDDDSEPTDLGYNAVTLDIYADDGDDTFDNLTDRLVDSLSTSNNQAGGSEDGEYSSLLSTGGDYWVEVTDTGTVIPVAVSPSGPDREAAQVNTTGDWTVAFAGTTNASFGYGEDLPDADNDNIPTAEEDAGPNAGDANGDSVLDSKQSHVASSQNENTQNHYNVLQLNPAATTCTQIDNFDFTTEADLTTQDEDYDYPLGLVDFTISCTNPGDQAAVTYILDQQYDTSDWQWRKYNSTTNEYQDITDQVVFGEVTIDGTTKTTVSYNLQDGSSLDEDNLANGTIIDPAGAALPAEDLSETGAMGLLAPILGTTVVATGAGVAMRVRKRVWRV